MATYFHGGNPEIQSEGLHKLYLMNPNYIAAYNSASADTSQHHHHQQLQQQQQPAASNQNMILPNSSLPHALQHSQFSHAPPSAQSQFLALPYAQAISADEPCRSGNSFYHDLWSGRGGQVEVCVSQPYQIQLGSSHVSPGTNQQGLSLSLSSQPRRGGGGNGNLYGNRGGGSTLSAVQVEVVGGEEESDKGVENFIMGSKYLKATQELLDEVVNVGKEAAMTTTATVNDHQLLNKEEKVVMQMESNINGGENNEAGGGGSVGAPSAAEQLSMAQRQEFQMKKTKLISMLDEVDQRYRQYHHQMNTVMSSFEQVAGHGSARSYTSLALKTISKQFRCLKDAIASQIKETSKSCEDDCLGVKGEGSPRLRMIDHQIRQHRALQHLGMMQHNAWRPQRGLPERAVSVLRAWLFEHFLHPYPKDSDKQMLAKQTGLARSQVSNWFINARVRLWKPMVEEMYLEEVKDHEEEEQKDSNNNGANASTSKSTDLNYKQRSDSIGQPDPNAAPYDISNSSIISASPNSSAFQAPPPGFVLIGSSTCDMDGFLQYKSLKKPRGNEAQNSPSSILSMDMEMKAAGEMSFSRQQHHLNNNATARFSYTGHNGSNGGGFGPYFQLGELGRFNQDHQLTQSFHGNSNNGSVSLTLGLPPGENLSQTYFSGQNMQGARADDFCGINNNNNNNLQTSPRTNMGFQNMDIQNGKRHAAQLLPDFVA